ncbi:probable choline kinase 2 isoform X2 [Andrographis paniculata]|uniref:probable choline kinase 2 isoform X2 n=1 Tax=Andrographis paniculata TaxID=175694 RepID=UPI0021E8724F|nr:probable choline kinase 2 isoform X2 [Andrographis paniculata]
MALWLSLPSGNGLRNRLPLPLPCHWRASQIPLRLFSPCQTSNRKFHFILSCAMSGGVESHLPEEANKFLKSLAVQWGDIPDPEALEVTRLNGAMTNKVYQIKWRTDSNRGGSRKALVRIYGAGVEVFFKREDEIRTFEFMSEQGRGPPLLGHFPNGRIEEFIRARTLTAADLRDPEISALIATKMKEFHGLDMPGSKAVVLWDRLRNWLKKAKQLSPVKEAEEFSLKFLEDEISALEENLSACHQLVGFCHNDLQYGNLMINDESRLITIIDYEYASYNHVAFDIANHFCEMAADYHTKTPHVLDYSQYPNDLSSDSEVKKLLQAVEKYTLASHLVWGLWGIISDHVNKIDFDYKEYARQRFQRYWATKSELLELSKTYSYL